MMTAISHDTPESKVLVSRLLELCSTKLNHIIHVTIYENPRERERGVVEGANAEEASVSLLWTGMAQDTTCRHMQFHCWVRNTWSWYQVQLLRANSSYYQLSHSASTALPRASSCSLIQAAVIMTDGILVNFRIWLQKQTHISVI